MASRKRSEERLKETPARYAATTCHRQVHAQTRREALTPCWQALAPASPACRHGATLGRLDCVASSVRRTSRRSQQAKRVSTYLSPSKLDMFFQFSKANVDFTSIAECAHEKPLVMILSEQVLPCLPTLRPLAALPRRAARQCLPACSRVPTRHSSLGSLPLLGMPARSVAVRANLATFLIYLRNQFKQSTPSYTMGSMNA